MGSHALRDAEMCDAATNENPIALAYTPYFLRTYERCFHAMKLKTNSPPIPIIIWNESLLHAHQIVELWLVAIHVVMRENNCGEELLYLFCIIGTLREVL